MEAVESAEATGVTIGWRHQGCICGVGWVRAVTQEYGHQPIHKNYMGLKCIGCLTGLKEGALETICIEVTHVVQSNAISARNGY